MIKNKRGFTLAELMVGVAMLGILSLVVSSFFIFTAKTKKEITNELEDSIETILAERMILKDLKFSEPSFNNVILADDNGLNFFDYVVDVTDQANDKRSRQITLSANSNKDFVFIVQNDKVGGGSIIYTPSLAYDVGIPPSNPFVPATLQFKSLNKNNELAKTNGRLWNKGAILMMDTPAMVRSMTGNGPDYSRPARSPFFIGVVREGVETRLKPLNLPGSFNFSNPMYPNETILNEDQFLRNIPPIGGAAALVRLKVVSVIKYYIAKDSKTQRVNFWRAVHDGNDFSSPQLFASNIEKVIFTRKDAHDGVIHFNIVYKGK